MDIELRILTVQRRLCGCWTEGRDVRKSKICVGLLLEMLGLELSNPHSYGKNKEHVSKKWYKNKEI